EANLLDEAGMPRHHVGRHEGHHERDRVEAHGDAPWSPRVDPSDRTWGASYPPRRRQSKGARGPGPTGAGRGVRPGSDRAMDTEILLRVDGAVEQPLELGFEDLRAFPEADQVADVSRFQPARKGDGVALEALLRRARPTPEANYLTLHAGK